MTQSAAVSSLSVPPDDPFLAAVLRGLPGAVLADDPWLTQARPEQRTPPGDWSTWLLLAGRGFGKTRTGAEDAKAYGLRNPGARIAVVAPTIADARDTCLEGESGLLAVLPHAEVSTWNRSLGELVLRNGSRFKLFSADEPNRLRGPQHHRAWCDELAAWRYPDAWDQLMFGLRLGKDPRVIVTTTPRPVPLVKRLMERDDGSVHVTRGSTFDNASNLAPAAVAELRARYEGTRLGRQELHAELLLDVEGALWSWSTLEDGRVTEAPDLQRVVVAIDPAVTSGEESDETGIIAAGLGIDGDCYVLADRTCRLSPDGWARRALALADEHQAERMVAEVNNGGDLVERVIRTVEPRVSYRAVHASRGKRTRAEPVAALYEQGRVHHVGLFPELEEQLTGWTPESGTSPDRLDALVWAVTELMLEPRKAKMRSRFVA